MSLRSSKRVSLSFPGIVGYRDTVIPQIINGILSRHDLLFLGLRGQAKTRILRMLPELLDEWMPVLSGVEINDDPLLPRTRAGQRLLAEQKEDAKIEWVHRSDRYHEKLATPDVTIADLIGEIDLVKHAEGRYLSDESTMHFGLIPRSNRGIFAINELPDLAPRIQVGLSTCWKSATSRSAAIRSASTWTFAWCSVPTPRITPIAAGSSPRSKTASGRSFERIIRKPSPRVSRSPSRMLGVAHRCRLVERHRGFDATLHVRDRRRNRPPRPIESACEPGLCVSVRTSIANLETAVSNAERRGILTQETRVIPRICDLNYLIASCRGRSR